MAAVRFPRPKTPHLSMTLTSTPACGSPTNSPSPQVKMLREFLFLQSLLGRTIVISLVLAAFLLPFGFAIRGFLPVLPQWVAYVPSAVPLSMLVFVLLWTLLGLFGLVPSKIAPWALSVSTIWIGVLRPA